MAESNEEPEVTLDLRAIELELALRKPELEQALEALRRAERIDPKILDLVIDI